MASRRNPSITGLQPKANLSEHGINDFLIVPVQIRLAAQVMVKIILFATRIPLPRRATKNREPVIRRGAVGIGVGPDIPIGLRICPVLAALLKPKVLIRSMSQDHVDDDLQSSFMRGHEQEY